MVLTGEDSITQQSQHPRSGDPGHQVEIQQVGQGMPRGTAWTEEPSGVPAQGQVHRRSSGLQTVAGV